MSLGRPDVKVGINLFLPTEVISYTDEIERRERRGGEKRRSEEQEEKTGECDKE